MHWVELLFALVLAAVIVSGFSYGFRWRGPWDNVFVFFLILFLGIWAGGLWLVPFGPALWGAHWLPILWIGLIFALLFAALTPPRQPRTNREAREEVREEAAAAVTVGVFFWILVALLAVAVMVRIFP